MPAPDILAIDTETTGVEWGDVPFCVSIADGLSGWAYDIRDAVTLGEVTRRLDDADIWVFHNAKFDLQMLSRVGIRPKDSVGIHDTHLMAHLLNENRDNSLKGLAKSVLGIDDLVAVEIKTGPNKGKTKWVPKEQHDIREARRKLKLKPSDGYEKIPWSIVKPYAIKDSEYTLRLFNILCPLIDANGLVHVYDNEIALIKVLMSMEEHGLQVDRERLSSMLEEMLVEQTEFSELLQEEVGNEDFNPGSPIQVKEALREQGWEVESTDKYTLSEISDKCHLAKLILSYRSVSKLINTYLLPLGNELDGDTLHPSYKANVRTGRMASGQHKGD